MTPRKGSKYREFYDLSGRITCMRYNENMEDYIIRNFLSTKKLYEIIYRNVFQFPNINESIKYTMSIYTSINTVNPVLSDHPFRWHGNCYRQVAAYC